MTLVRKSTMRVRTRYRATHSKKSNISLLVIINVLFLICYTIYQVILSRSNGGREAVVSTYRSFLKGGSLPLDSADGAVGDNQPKIQTIIQEHQSIEENQVEIPQIAMLYDPLSEKNEVTLQSDIFSEKDGGEAVAPAILVELNEKKLPIQGVSGPSYVFDPDHQMFHNYYSGKSGKVIQEMLIAHAYIFHQNATYGGCCGNRSAKMTAHEDLLDALGLKDVLRFRCPRDFIQDTKTRRSVIQKSHYMAEDIHVWTPEYVYYLRSLVTYPERRHKQYTIVIHMLRGNTSPCKKENRGFHSYLPNLHYQNLIDKYMKPGARVIIYTSAKSFESLNEFRNRGYKVNTDTSLKETWKEFATGDVFIMSRSDFSMVPAMVASGIVVYTPFWHHSLRQWQRVGKSIMKQTDEETIRLQEKECVFPGE